jgi:hypothetical protein
MDDFTQVACKVYGVLLEVPKARDCDRLLLSTIWARETRANNVDEFLDELEKGYLTHFESIRRMRQKIQEYHVGLRGNKYDSRHGMEGAICEQLSFFDMW